MCMQHYIKVPPYPAPGAALRNSRSEPGHVQKDAVIRQQTGQGFTARCCPNSVFEQAAPRLQTE
jgi:hypothetical protein